MKYSSKYIFVAMLLVSCASPNDQDRKVVTQPPSPWTLDFFYFYNSKLTHRESIHYDTRRDCFDAMYQMQVDARKQAKHSGSGICTKWFSEGQERTNKDLLGYR